MGILQNLLLLHQRGGGEHAQARLHRSRHQKQHHHGHKEIGGRAQHPGAGAHPPQVGHHHQQHRQQAEGYPLRLQGREKEVRAAMPAATLTATVST